MTLIELAEKVEAATGPDRELDAEIKAAFGHAWDYAADWGPRGHDKPVAFPYTASLDAAATLVPDGLCWRIAVFPRGNALAAALVEGGSELTARTPALALCAASLRARATQENG